MKGSESKRRREREQRGETKGGEGKEAMAIVNIWKEGEEEGDGITGGNECWAGWLFRTRRAEIQILCGR